MSTVHEVASGDAAGGAGLAALGGTWIQYTKGAPDEVLKRCTKAYMNGKVVPMTDKIRDAILTSNKAMADRALRVLCAAERVWDACPNDFIPEYLEQDLTYIGLSGMIDPVRPEVKAAIAQCRDAGIRRGGRGRAGGAAAEKGNHRSA